MTRRWLTVHCLVLALLLAGCTGGAGPGTVTPTPTEAAGDGPTTTTAHPSTPEDPITVSETPTPDGMPAQPAALPSTERCLTDSVPSPTVTAGANGSLSGRSYPASPDPTNASAVRRYVAAFEETYVYNRLLAEADPTDAPLTRVTTQVTRTNLTRFQGGYFVMVSGLGATKYADGVHGDYGISAVYRVSVDGVERSGRVEQGARNFLPVVAC